MHLPYTDNYPEVVAIAAGSLGASLCAALWARPLPRRASNLLFATGVAVTTLYGFRPELSTLVKPDALPMVWLWFELGALLATLALFWSKPRSLGLLALAGQAALGALGVWVKASEHELMFAHLAWFGTLLGAHGLLDTPRHRGSERRSRLSYPVQDTVIFLLTVPLALYVTASVYEFLIYNGDEVANTFQANLYGHLRAYGAVPPCPSAFENYWVFSYQGRTFSQYTPGWPLFMAVFDRLRLIWLAGPVMGGIVAVGIARLARRLASALGGSYEQSEHIVAVSGPLAALLSMLGPSLLLNAASRFSHTMVAACFAWSVESAAELTSGRLSRSRALFFGFLLGSTAALGLATRPADGGFLGVGVFLYFLQALARRRIRPPAFAGACLGFALFGGLTLVILRLQLGAWFETGYSVTPLFHPEGKLVLSLPLPYELKFGIPLATGSYCWWPVAPALAAVGLVRALGGRGRGVAFMLAVSSLCLVGFYSLVEFGRGSDDGLGPRYVLPIVVAQGAGTGACLAPIVARLFDAVRSLELARLRRVRDYGPALLVFAAAAYGVIRIAPHMYPVAYAEYHAGTTPLRVARERHFTHAIVMIHPEDAVQGFWNVTQNAPMDPEPDVLFLARRSPADEACARASFPGRKWYRVHVDGSVEPLSADP